MSDTPSLFRRETSGAFVVVYVDGEIDIVLADTVTKELEAAIDAGPPHLLVDLSGVTFLDSSALAALVRVHRHAVAAKGTIRLVGPTPRVAKLLSLTQLDHLLPVYDTAEDAIADLGLSEPADD